MVVAEPAVLFIAGNGMLYAYDAAKVLSAVAYADSVQPSRVSLAEGFQDLQIMHRQVEREGVSCPPPLDDREHEARPVHSRTDCMLPCRLA